MINFLVSFLFIAALWHRALTVHALATSPCRGVPQNQHPSHLDLVFNSLRKSAGIDLASRFNLPANTEFTPSSAKFVYEHPTLVLLSHSTDPDPIFTYANAAAQRLFKMDYTTFTSTPSRYSAEEGDDREKRQIFMEKVKSQRYVDDYEGIRVASDKSRFLIRAIVWELFDEDNVRRGAAAFFDSDSVEHLR
mmetsp:Transcript_22232/g.46177  ORF Transcript_22232/g.46177 Transcript_22232/m.46177 type:complete len:192 (-) Transcript_22232:23-598(-)